MSSTLNREAAKRKRSRYIADSLGFELRKCRGKPLWHPVALMVTIDQLRFMRAALNKAAKR
mgnify:CR=1 FL=1